MKRTKRSDNHDQNRVNVPDRIICLDGKEKNISGQ
jgi:hypothetical protein